MDELWNVQQTADYLHLEARTLRKMARAGRIPAMKAGGAWRFSPQRIQEWMEGSKCLVIATIQSGIEVHTGDGSYYPPGTELPNGATFEMGIFVGPRVAAEDFMRRYGGLLITGALA